MIKGTLRADIISEMVFYSPRFRAFANRLFGLSVPCHISIGSISITSDGHLIGDYTNSTRGLAESETHQGAHLGSAIELRRNVQSLADQLHLNKSDRAQINVACALACTDHSDNIHNIKVF